MTETGYKPDINLEELRDQLASRMALLLLVIASGLVAWLILPSRPISLAMFGLLSALAGLGLGTWGLIAPRPAAARHLLVWSLTAGLLLAMIFSPEPWLPFVGLMLAFPSALLVSGGGFVTMGAIVALAAWLTWDGRRAYPLPHLLAMLLVGAVLAWLITRTLYTALEWAWTMQQQATRLLEIARDRQGELNRTLRSLDLTNYILRRTQRELVFARQQAEEARLMKEQFAANVSHELRTPLNLILGFSEVMCLSSEVYGEMEWPPTLRQDVYQIYRSSRHLLEMIDDVLDLSRFEITGFTLNREPTPLEPLLRDAVNICKGLFRSQPVRLEVKIGRDLPTLKIDRIRVRQVLINLLKNAARFTEEGTVRVEAKRVAGEVLISVSDTGPGIPADEIPHLFQEFYQIDRSLHRKNGGTGLGLAISKHFVDAHDGRIWVESEEGIGSTFTFTLPIPGELVLPSRTTAKRPVGPSWIDMRPPILVVDPDPQVASLIDRHLEAYEVLHVEDAQYLVEAVALHHPQAVICNVLPGEQGSYEKAISDIAPLGNNTTFTSVPLITCSLPSQAWVASDLEVTACLNKPITAERLLHEIERLEGVQDVLVVDDDRAFCRLVERMLKASGRIFSVRQAYDGQDGLHALRTRRPDLLLLDLMMPGVDGFHVLKEMQQDAKLVDLPVILLTAISLAEDALMQRRGQVVVRRSDGLSPVEALRCLGAVVNVLEARYDEKSVPQEALV